MESFTVYIIKHGIQVIQECIYAVTIAYLRRCKF